MVFPMLLAVSKCVPQDWPASGAIRNVLRVAAVGCIFAVIGTFSRGGLLALATGFAFHIAVQKGHRLKLVSALAVGGLFAALLIDLPEGYTDRVESIVSYSDTGEASALSRLHFWRVAIDMVKDHPLGVGMFNFPLVYDQYDFSNGLYGRARPVHSSHFQVLAEQGVPGLAVWVLLFATAFHACFKTRRVATTQLKGTSDGQTLSALATGLMASMAAFVVGGAFSNLSLNDLTWVTFALVAALDRVRMSSVRALDKGSGFAPAEERPGQAALTARRV
jgi:putative inorganic carbon (HCO3(-)) transporter